LEIEALSEVETYAGDPFANLNLVEPDWAVYASEAMQQRYAEYLTPSVYVGASREVRDLAATVRTGSGEVVARFVLDLTRYLYENFSYDPDVTHVHTTVDEVLSLRAGVCQDFAHLMLACCRSQGVPARYVSGYLYSGSGDHYRGSEAMHAWVEVATPEGRWVQFDPTNDVLPDARHVRVHTGRDYGDITPLRGIYMGTQALSLDVELRVESLPPVEGAKQDIA
jgi:transglutaminase-like putative cysteine protease